MRRHLTLLLRRGILPFESRQVNNSLIITSSLIAQHRSSLLPSFSIQYRTLQYDSLETSFISLGLPDNKANYSTLHTHLIDHRQCSGASPPPFHSLLRHYSKAPKNKAAKKGGSSPSSTTPTNHATPTKQTDTEFDLSQYKSQMNQSIHHLQHELANLRTGRATPGMLDHLKVDAYGEKVPLKAVGTVSVRGPQLLVVTLFDPNLAESVVSGIEHSPLKLNPRAEGHEILVPVPSPTAETLVAMGKMCKTEGESAKVSIRHVRKAAMDSIKGMDLAEDEKRRQEKDIQQLTDGFIDEVEQLVASKLNDIAKHNS